MYHESLYCTDLVHGSRFKDKKLLQGLFVITKNSATMRLIVADEPDLGTVVKSDGAERPRRRSQKFSVY